MRRPILLLFLSTAFALPAGHALGQDELPQGHPQVDRPETVPGEAERFDEVRDDPDLPRGTIVARVVDPAGEPVAGARVELGALGRGSPPRRTATTDSSGEARWDRLPAGPDQSYRVVAPNGLARFGSEPLRMSKRHGFRVTVTRFPVTTSRDTLLVFVLRSFFELAEEGDRLKVTQHLQLMNFGQEAIADAHGIPFPLPAGAMAFRTEEDMGDQRLVERNGKILVEGAVPPGQVQLAYGFDLPVSGRQISIRQAIPYRLVVGEVYVEKALETRVVVEGMPEVREIDLEGRTFLATRLSRRPESEPFDALVVRISNLPGPGPGRWIALVLSVLVMGLGLLSALSAGDRRASERGASRVEREALLEESVRLEKRKERGKIDAATYDRARERIVQRIAELLHLDDKG